MQVQLAPAKWLRASLFTLGVASSFPLYSQGIAYPPAQWVAPPPPFALGMVSGAQFGAHVSAANPAMRCFGGRSFSCGAHFDPRPIFAGALIGGLLGALSTPIYYQTPFEHVGSSQHTPAPPSVNSGHAAWIADTWQQFGEERRDPAERNGADNSRFVDSWQKFFEPAR